MSEHFSVEELTFSETAARLGLSNEPDELVLANLRKLSVELLEPIRAHLSERRGREVPVIVSSGYRSPAVNVAVGGSKTSDHMLGLAADIRAVGFSPRELATEIASIAHRLPLRQLILEFERWCHVSHGGELPKRQILTASRVDGRTVYSSTESFV